MCGKTHKTRHDFLCILPLYKRTFFCYLIATIKQRKKPRRRASLHRFPYGKKARQAQEGSQPEYEERQHLENWTKNPLREVIQGFTQWRDFCGIGRKRTRNTDKKPEENARAEKEARQCFTWNTKANTRQCFTWNTNLCDCFTWNTRQCFTWNNHINRRREKWSCRFSMI